jgi:hypothetical protein
VKPTGTTKPTGTATTSPTNPFGFPTITLPSGIPTIPGLPTAAPTK